MFIKVIHKVVKSTGERVSCYRLCESYRFDNATKHTNILHLGRLEELPDVEQKRALAIRLNELVKESHTGIKSLFKPEAAVEQLATFFFNQIKEKQRLDITNGKDYQRIDTDSIKHKEVKEIGTEWLCLQAINQLGIADFLQQAGWPAQQIQLALTHIISRVAYPASELRTCNWIKQNSAVCELTGYPLEKITKDKLYEVSRALYSVKEALEKQLSTCTNELFDLDDKIIIYDLTNTYFEGSMRSSKIAKFGRSKEKRSDAKLIVLAVVVNTEGFLKYSQIFDGNTADCNTVQNIIEELSARTSSTEKHPIVVLDAGIATEDNLALLKNNGFDYMCVSRSGMKNYSIDITQKTIVIKDKKDQPVTLLKAVMPNSTDNWLQVHSEAKAMKESGMNSRFSQAFEQGLTQIKESNGKKRGIKKQAKVWERIGRLKAKYPSIHKHYEILTETDKAGIVTSIQWKQKEIDNKDGFYLLRTTLDEKDETVQWAIYNTIREVEATFRVLKTDLDLRPIYHKTDEASMAHLHLGLLAYWVVNTIRHQLKQKGINNQWNDIARMMETQKLVTTNLTNEFEQPIIIRQCSEPIEAVAKIYEALKYKHKPFTRKKLVVPPPKLKKNENQAQCQFMDG